VRLTYSVRHIDTPIAACSASQRPEDTATLVTFQSLPVTSVERGRCPHAKHLQSLAEHLNMQMMGFALNCFP
jgi:hypothetical protein